MLKSIRKYKKREEVEEKYEWAVEGHSGADPEQNARKGELNAMEKPMLLGNLTIQCFD